MFKCNVQHSRTNQLISIVREKKTDLCHFLYLEEKKTKQFT